ncbi:hypothetical protein GGI35DRAFT_444194 [Trichoderma velutinum]
MKLQPYLIASMFRVRASGQPTSGRCFPWPRSASAGTGAKSWPWLRSSPTCAIRPPYLLAETVLGRAKSGIRRCTRDCGLGQLHVYFWQDA